MREPGRGPRNPDELRMAYVMSRFPKLTETFVLYEILAVEALGVDVEIFPLLRQKEDVRHPDAEEATRRAHFLPFLSWEVLRENWRALRRDPRTYMRTLAEVAKGTWGSPNFFLGGLAVFPKCVAFARRMERLGVHHIHAHFANHPAVAALVVHRLTGIPYSFTAHGSDLQKDQRMLDRKITASVFALTVSEYNRKLMVEACDGRPAAREKVRVLHCGVDLRELERGEDTGSPERAGRPLEILCVASMREVKGHRILVEACRLLEARGVPFVCHLVGGGPLLAEIEDMVREEGLEERVRMHGPRARPEVLEFYRRSDVYVQPSVPTTQGQREGIPVSLMEAMGSELPVVASRIGGIPELVEDGRSGRLVPPGDPASLAEALTRLAEDGDLRRRMGAEGRTRVERDFDLHANARALVEHVLAASRGRAGGRRPTRAGSAGRGGGLSPETVKGNGSPGHGGRSSQRAPPPG